MNFLETITYYEIKFLQKGPITKQTRVKQKIMELYSTHSMSNYKFT